MQTPGLDPHSEPETARFVAGFLFDVAGKAVVLVRKARPAWQAGRLNGVGGRVEAGESGPAAMAREFREEAGVATAPSEWRLFAALTESAQTGRVRHEVSFFAARSPVALGAALSSCTDERVELLEMSELHARQGECLEDLLWLLPLALACLKGRAPTLVRVIYSGGQEED